MRPWLRHAARASPSTVGLLKFYLGTHPRHLQRKLVETARAALFDDKKVADEQAARVAFVDDVHLQSERMARLVNQFSILVKKKPILRALHPVETDLRLVARIGA